MYRYLFLLPALATAVETTTTLYLASGYRIDRYEQKAAVAGTDTTATFKDFGSATINLNAHMHFNRDFFARTFSTYGFMVQQPKLSATGASDTIGEKKYVFAVGGAVGWQFNLAGNTIALSPEFGYDYTRLKFDDTRYIAVGAPFASLSLTWNFVHKAAMDLGFEYAFAGARREIFFQDNDKITGGSYQGPKAKIHLTYHLTPSWEIGAGYTFRYLFSNQKNFTFTAGSVNGMQTTWTTHSAQVNCGYTF